MRGAVLPLFYSRSQLSTEKILPWSNWFVLFHRTAKKLAERRYWPATKEATWQLYMLVNCFYFRALDEQSFEARMERVGQLHKYCGGTPVIKCEGGCCSFSFQLKGMNQIDFIRRAPRTFVAMKCCFCSYCYFFKFVYYNQLMHNYLLIAYVTTVFSCNL